MLSREIQDKFQEAVQSCPTTGERQEPHAVWDGEIGQYHVFFPRDFTTPTGTNETFDRLTFTYEPGVGRGGFRSFSFSPLTNISCASFFARPDTSAQISALQVGTWGNGTGDGQDLTRGSKPAQADMSIRTPLLSLNTPDQYKMFKRLIVRAVGTADFTITVFDQDNNNLQSTTVRPEADSFASTAGISGDQTRPIDIPIPHRAKAISLQFSTTSSSSGYSVVGDLRILDFALVVDIK